MHARRSASAPPRAGAAQAAPHGRSVERGGSPSREYKSQASEISVWRFFRSFDDLHSLCAVEHLEVQFV
jgi:hypothetical protein